jgi:multimeric flavodoxin WrbA
MKVVAFNGSARKGGNTAILLGYVLGELAQEGIETELVELAGAKIHGCLACRKCSTRKDRRCSQTDDMGNACIDKMAGADGILLGSPTYVTDVSPEIKALIDRACLVSGANGGMFRRKVGAAVVAVRRAGAIHAFDTLNHFFLITEMIVPGSSYWNIGFGRERGEVEKDEEGIRTMKTLGRNMAWLLKKVIAPDKGAV